MIGFQRTTTRAAMLMVTGLLFTATAAAAQAVPIHVEEDTGCQYGDDDRDRYCEEREYQLDPESELRIDAGQNGGIEVNGWDRDEIRLIARINASSRSGDPRELARAVEIRTGSSIEAVGPRTRDRESWSVGFELMVPRATALHLRASNGGISLRELTGHVSARTTNGGISLLGGAGRVLGETTNGGLRIALTGNSWHGDGVELRTTNGGVEITVPDHYSADLEIATVNGGMQLDIPIMVQGRIDREVRTRLGSGGPVIRATTTNGGVVIRR